MNTDYSLQQAFTQRKAAQAFWPCDTGVKKKSGQVTKLKACHMRNRDERVDQKSLYETSESVFLKLVDQLCLTLRAPI